MHKFTRHRRKHPREMDEKAKDGPAKYEGKEHVHYEEPIHSRHHIRFPDDEPHMKSHADEEEEHEAEDDFHMDVPHDTEYTLPKHIKRAHMYRDDVDEPLKRYGNLVSTGVNKGVLDDEMEGEEKMGPEYMQEDSEHKDRRKKMIAAVVKRKMKMHHGKSMNHHSY